MQRTAMGEELSLPESRPVVSLALAAVALAAGLAYLDDLPTPQASSAGAFGGVAGVLVLALGRTQRDERSAVQQLHTYHAPPHALPRLSALRPLVPQLAMDSVSVAVGARWQLFTAALQPYSAFNTAATVAALFVGGQAAEKRLGSGLFAASFFLAGATSAILW